jgi:hypothetical protein
MSKYTLGLGALLLVLMLGPPARVRAGTLPVAFNNGGSNVMGGVYVGPYSLTLTVGSTQGTVQLVCDDAADEVYSGETWNAYTSTYPSLSYVQYPQTINGSGEAQNYAEAAWLVQQMFSPTYKSNAAVVGEMQWALWDIFDPVISTTETWGVITSAQQTQISYWLGQAQSNYASGNYSNVVIYTPVPGSQIPLGDGPPQEYIGLGTPQAMAEPMTLWTLLAVLLVLALACWRLERAEVSPLGR